MRELLIDLRFGFRILRRNPAVAGAAILALALGIGANTAIFSAVNAVLLRPLPFPQPDRLVTIRMELASRNIHSAFGPYADIAEWRQRDRDFVSLAAYASGSVNLKTSGEPERVTVWRVNAEFFSMLGVRAAQGREFTREEDRPGGPRAAILSDGLWRRRFGTDPAIVGKTVTIDGDPYSVAGILPASFRLEATPVDLYLPLAMSEARTGREAWNCGVYARLRPGISIAQAQSRLDTVVRDMEQQSERPLRGFRAKMWGAHEFQVREVRLSLVVLLWSVGLVLLIACANVANLLLAMGGARQREIAIRAALGVKRSRLLRQLLTESTALATAGGAFGVLLAYWIVTVLPAMGTERFPMLAQARLDPAVFGFTAALSLLSGLIFGLAPALAISRTDIRETLTQGAEGPLNRRGRGALRNLLVVSEVALALLLTIGASLMMRSLLNLQDVQPGFNPTGVLTASINLPAARYARPESVTGFYQQLQENLKTTPGVAAAAITSSLPLTGHNQGMGLLIRGRPVAGPSDVPILWARRVSPLYFEAMQIPLRKGRLFTDRDLANSARVAIVSDTLARRYWPDGDALGKSIGNGSPEGWMTVVGMVGSVRHMSLSEPPDAEIYFPFAQGQQRDMTIVVRTSADPLRFAPVLRRAIAALDAEQPISRMASMEQRMSDAVATKRFSATLLAIFAGVALALASIGVYGVVSFSVTRRKHEIGIRMAMGAHTADVVRMVVRQGTSLALLGVGIGLAAAFALTRAIESLLFGVKTTDPLVFVGAPLLLTVVAAVASYLPARRAARIDPGVALRYQ